VSVTLQQLQARCEATGGTFTFVQTAGTNVTGGGSIQGPVGILGGAIGPQLPFPGQYRIPHASPNRTLIQWSAVYRTHRIAGYALVVDSAIAASYVQCVLDQARGCLDSWDLRDSIPYSQTGFPNPGVPGRQGYGPPG
jgi:hypothetical protein